MKLSHMTFIVRDIERSTELSTELFDAKVGYSSKEKQSALFSEKFFMIRAIYGKFRCSFKAL